eukprot:762919-Hanusia_phi.AAC.2
MLKTPVAIRQQLAWEFLDICTSLGSEEKPQNLDGTGSVREEIHVPLLTGEWSSGFVKTSDTADCNEQHQFVEKLSGLTQAAARLVEDSQVVCRFCSSSMGSDRKWRRKGHVGIMVSIWWRGQNSAENRQKSE